MVMVIGQDHGDPLLAKGSTSKEELTEDSLGRWQGELEVEGCKVKHSPQKFLWCKPTFNEWVLRPTIWVLKSCHWLGCWLTSCWGLTSCCLFPGWGLTSCCCSTSCWGLTVASKVCGNFQAGAREGRCCTTFKVLLQDHRKEKWMWLLVRCRVTPAPGGRIAWVEGDYRGDRSELVIWGWWIFGWSIWFFFAFCKFVNFLYCYKFLTHYPHDPWWWLIRLEGRAKVAFNDGEKLDGFFKEGVLHGFARCDGDDDVGAETSTERERKQSPCLTGASSQDDWDGRAPVPTGFVSFMIHDPHVDDDDLTFPSW